MTSANETIVFRKQNLLKTSRRLTLRIRMGRK